MRAKNTFTEASVSSELASATTATGSSTEVDSSAATGATSTTCSVVSALALKFKINQYHLKNYRLKMSRKHPIYRIHVECKITDKRYLPIPFRIKI
jgi:hypothetical protein